MVLDWLPLLDSQLFPAGCRPPVSEEQMQTKASGFACMGELVKRTRLDGLYGCEHGEMGKSSLARRGLPSLDCLTKARRRPRERMPRCQPSGTRELHSIT